MATVFSWAVPTIVRNTATPVQSDDAATKGYVDSQSTSAAGPDGAVQYNSGNVFAGSSGFTTDGQNIVLAGNVLGAELGVAASGNLLLSSGGNVVLNNSVINNVANPVQDQDAATKSYVDGMASGLQIKEVCQLATAVALPTNVYNNGTAGVGATLTGAANGALVVDSSAVLVSERILVKDEAAQQNNGIYTVTTVGDGSTPYVLTRSADCNQTTEFNGAYTFILGGTLNINSSWVCTASTTNPITVGTTPVDFVQFSQAPTYAAGPGITIFGATIAADVDGSTIGINGSNELFIPTGATLSEPVLSDATGDNINLTGSLTATAGVFSAGTISGNDVLANELVVSTFAQVNGGIEAGQVVTGAIFGPSVYIGTTTPSGDITLDPNGDGNVSLNNSYLTNVLNPVNSQDAATKSYVDNQLITSSYGNANVANYLSTSYAGQLGVATSIAIGNAAGSGGAGAVAIGSQAGDAGQGTQAIAIGQGAGNNTQALRAIAIGAFAGNANQGGSAIAIGFESGQNGQQNGAIAMGRYAGQTTQGQNSIAIGLNAGNVTQGTQSIALGVSAAQINQGALSVAIGNSAGLNNQGTNSVALGSFAGATTQSANSVAVGVNAGRNNQGTFAVAIGTGSGQVSQGTESVSIGSGAGLNNQGTQAIAIGVGAGTTNQRQKAVAIGQDAGSNTQGTNSVAIGFESGKTQQGNNSVAIGSSAGQTNQGDTSIAIGAFAGTSSQADGTIILNAQNSQLNGVPGQTDSLYIDPIRNQSGDTGNLMYYNPTTKEVTYGTSIPTASFVKYTRTTDQTGIVDGGTTIICNVLEARAGDDIQVNTNTGEITLAPNKTYRLRGTVGYCNVTNGTAGAMSYQWFNVNRLDSVGQGGGVCSPNSGATNAWQSGTAEYVFTPTVTTRMTLQVVGTSNSNTIQVRSGGFVDNRWRLGAPFIDIEVIANNPPVLPQPNSTIPNWENAGAIVLTGETTTPTFPTSMATNNVYYRQIGLKTWQVQGVFKSNSNIGATAGNGSYILTLPAGLQFDTTLPFQSVFTGGGIQSSPSFSVKALIDSKATSYGTNLTVLGGAGKNGSVVPYSATQYRLLLPIDGLTGFWSSYTNPLDCGGSSEGLEVRWGFTFQTP